MARERENVNVRPSMHPHVLALVGVESSLMLGIGVGLCVEVLMCTGVTRT